MSARRLGPPCGCARWEWHEEGCLDGLDRRHDVDGDQGDEDGGACWACASIPLERMEWESVNPGHDCLAGRVRLQLLGVAS